MSGRHALSLHKKDLSSFTLLIGGLAVHVENSICADLIDGEPAEYSSFLCPSSEVTGGAQMSMEMKLVSEPFVSSVDRTVFSEKYYRIHEVLDGFLVLRYGVQQQQIPYVTIQVDRNFSKFAYGFYAAPYRAGKKQPLFPVVSALDALLLKHSLINHQGLIIHAAGGAVQGKGMVFTALSGTGKSTICRLLSQSQNNRLFSEERIIIRSFNKEWKVWGTPWHGESKIALNESVPLAAVIFLRQARKTAITRLHPSDALHRLLQTVSVPWYSEEWTNKGLAVCETLLQDIPMFELSFKPDYSAVKAVESLAAEL